MSYLSNKYKIPEETVKSMTEDGIISCKWSGYETVHKLRSEGKSIDDISFETGYSQRNILYILSKCKK